VAFILIIYIKCIYLIPDHDKIYYDSYSYDRIYINTRSNDTLLSDLDKGLILIENGKFIEASKKLKDIPNSITATYYSGVVHMELGEYEIAVLKFNTVINQRINIFYDQSYWYKGLCLLKLKKIDEAKEIFTKISKSDGYYKPAAESILGKLD